MRVDCRQLGNLWPSSAQLALLHCVLDPDPARARSAFVAWADKVDLVGDFDYQALRLLPMVHARMLAEKVEHPVMSRIRGVYRLSWVETQRRFHRWGQLLPILAQGTSRLVLLKGLPLALQYYDHPAHRPMMDVDIWVSQNELGAVQGMLQSRGWDCFERPVSSEDLAFRHALAYRNGDARAGDVDVHVHFLPFVCRPSVDRWFADQLEPVRFGEHQYLQLGPTALMLHTVLHGMQWNQETPVRWIVDAMLLARARGDQIDWDEMFDFAARNDLGYRLAIGLAFLQEHFALALPERVQACIRRTRPSLLERLECRYMLMPPSFVGSGWRLPLIALGHSLWMAARAGGSRGFAGRYLEYFRFVLRIPSQREIPLAIVRYARANAGRLLFGRPPG